MTPEEKARQKIDQLLNAAGWKVQDYRELNLSAALGVAVREFPLQSGFADYLLFIDRKAVGVIEAKPCRQYYPSIFHRQQAYSCCVALRCSFATFTPSPENL